MNQAVTSKQAYNLSFTLIDKIIGMKEWFRDETAYNNALRDIAIDIATMTEYHKRVRDNRAEELVDIMIGLRDCGIVDAVFFVEGAKGKRISYSTSPHSQDDYVWIRPCIHKPNVGHGIEWESLNRAEAISVFDEFSE